MLHVSLKFYDFTETLHSWPLWWHFVSVSIPDEIVYEDKAAIYISTGSNDDRCDDVVGAYAFC